MCSHFKRFVANRTSHRFFCGPSHVHIPVDRARTRIIFNGTKVKVRSVGVRMAMNVDEFRYC